MVTSYGMVTGKTVLQGLSHDTDKVSQVAVLRRVDGMLSINR
jgi:hypothetical protein